MNITIKTKEINIEDANIGQYVLCYDKDKKSKCYRKITKTHAPVVKKKDQIAIKLADDSVIYTSVWHPTLIKKDELTLDYVRADEMKIGDFMVSQSNELVEVVDLWSPEGIDENYADLTVDEHHNYFTSSNDGTKYVIHNTLGYHSLLQEKMIPFISPMANAMTNIIFKHIKEESERATLYMGELLGEPEWCIGTGRRNLTLLAIAPNRSSSKLAGGVSQGIEPIAANAYTDDDAKGLHIRRNHILERLLESKGKNVPAVWDQIMEDKGSVVNVRCLSADEKEVFKTFKEINQLELVRQAALRQKYIDQGQSVNLAFFQDAKASFINQVHIEAWKLGIKALYYLRSESVIRADSGAHRDLYSECVVCEG